MRPLIVRHLATLALVATACTADPASPDAPTPQPEPPSVPDAARAWIAGNALPFEGVSLDLGNEDLRFLDDLVGDARIVSLGENTHGTRDFFQTKARILRYLVEERGFDAFAIEATWPEANRLDHYVRTGEGDPGSLLAGLYFWTWNTEAVLEMIEWMRAHNEAGGTVGFYGFDMQFPGMALHNVTAYFEAVDPDRVEDVTARLDCLAAFANGPDGRFKGNYADASASVKDACGPSLRSVRALLDEHRAAYEAASSVDAFARARHSVTVALQYEAMVSGTGTRDGAMAENVVWLADQLGPGSKMVLWAHNYHVSTQPRAMGQDLRAHYGPDMVVFGFSHETGSFTAVRQRGGIFQGLATETLDPPEVGSLEWHLGSAPTGPFMIDLRASTAADEGSAWLRRPIPTRSIGCCYDATRAAQYWTSAIVAELYDVMIHFRATAPTRILSGRPPPVF